MIIKNLSLKSADRLCYKIELLVKGVNGLTVSSEKTCWLEVREEEWTAR